MSKLNVRAAAISNLADYDEGISLARKYENLAEDAEYREEYDYYLEKRADYYWDREEPLEAPEWFEKEWEEYVNDSYSEETCAERERCNDLMRSYERWAEVMVA